MFPNPQSGLEWPSIVVFSAKNDGEVHFGEKIFFGGHMGPQNTPKTPKTPQNGYFEAQSKK